MKKKILGMMMAIFAFFSLLGNAFAATIAMADFKTKFDEIITTPFNQMGSSISTVLDTENSKFKVLSNEDNSVETIMELNYTADYIEFDNRANHPTEDNIDDNFTVMVLYSGVLQSVLDLSGHDDKSIDLGDDDTEEFDKYNEYGLSFITESYNFNTSNGSSSGDYIRYIKLSLDTDKIDALVEKYGVDASTNDPNKAVISTLEPSLEAKDVTESSVVLYPSIPYTNTDPSYAVWCEIYRSTSEDGEYELVSDAKVNCLAGVGYTDENLEKNTTYWYKTKVDYGTIYSDPIKVTTKEKVANPKTGVKSYIIPLAVLITIIGSSLYIISRKTLFKL